MPPAASSAVDAKCAAERGELTVLSYHTIGAQHEHLGQPGQCLGEHRTGGGSSKLPDASKTVPFSPLKSAAFPHGPAAYNKSISSAAAAGLAGTPIGKAVAEAAETAQRRFAGAHLLKTTLLIHLFHPSF